MTKPKSEDSVILQYYREMSTQTCERPPVRVRDVRVEVLVLLGGEQRRVHSRVGEVQEQWLCRRGTGTEAVWERYRNRGCVGEVKEQRLCETGTGTEAV